MAVSCTPADIVKAAKCFACMPKQSAPLVKSYLLCQTAKIADPTAPCVAPGVPVILPSSNVPKGATGNSTISLKWQQPSVAGSFVKGYIVSWGTTSGVYTNSATLPKLPRQYDITGLNGGTTYFVVIKALGNAAGCNSANSAESSFTTNGSLTCTLSAKTLEWLARVNANEIAAGGGDGVPSMTTQCAVEAFYQGLVADGIDGKMVAVNLYIPDKVAVEPGGAQAIAMTRTPFYVGGGADPWQNQSFAAADLTVNGLISDGATKYLVTLLDPTLMGWTPASDCGLSVYVLDGSSNAGWGEMGVNKPSNSSVNMVLFCNLSGTSYGELIGFPTGTASGAAPNKAGFYGVSRTGVNAATLYFGNSTTPFAALGTTVGAAGVPPARGMLVHALANDDAGGVNNFTSGRRISFAAFHKGLTLAQHQALFNRVQALRVALGGGFA